jgi:anti-sigma factor RsiW
MNCDEAEVLIHALIDGELDAGHARDVEAHIAACPACAGKLREFEDLRKAMAPAGLRFAAPASLRSRIEGKLPLPQAATASRRSVIKGFAFGAGASAIAASGLLVMVMRSDDERRVVGEVVSAHLRSMQAQHLTDVVSTDQHAVKPWFNGKLDIAPPVADLTALGFMLLGGRLDYIDGKPVAAVVYRRRVHVINLFCAPAPDAATRAAVLQSLQGFNVRRWTENGLNLWAVSDIGADELNEFGEKFEAAVRQ